MAGLFGGGGKRSATPTADARKKKQPAAKPILNTRREDPSDGRGMSAAQRAAMKPTEYVQTGSGVTKRSSVDAANTVMENLKLK